MTSEMISTLMSTGLGVGGGSLTVGWIAKLLIKRFLAENDNKHALAAKSIESLAKAHRQSYQLISEKLSKITTDIEVVKTRMGEVMNVRDDVKLNSQNTAIALERIAANAEDIDAGFASIREQLKETKKQLSDIRNLKQA